MKKKIFGMSNRPRISIFRSNKEIYAQIIDDSVGKTLTYSSSTEKLIKNENKKKTKVKIANIVGKTLGIRAKKIGLKKLVFDKKNYLYHGRIKSLIEGIRKEGLDF